MTAKARIDIKEGIIELEGSETFVAKYLDEFKALVNAKPSEKVVSQPEKPIIPESKEKEISKPAPKKRGRKPGKTKAETKKENAKKVSIAHFDYTKTETRPDLKSLYEEKKPKNHGEGIAVIAYYLKQYQKAKTFSVKDVESSYKAIGITFPKHIGQVMYNNRELGYYEKTGKRSVWKLTEKGVSFVDSLEKK